MVLEIGHNLLVDQGNEAFIMQRIFMIEKGFLKVVIGMSRKDLNGLMMMKD